MAAITERKQCIFPASATSMLKENKSCYSTSSCPHLLPMSLSKSISLAFLVFLKLMGCSNFKHEHQSAQGDVMTLCGSWCSSLFDIFFLIQILLLHSLTMWIASRHMEQKSCNSLRYLPQTRLLPTISFKRSPKFRQGAFTVFLLQ